MRDSATREAGRTIGIDYISNELSGCRVVSLAEGYMRTTERLLDQLNRAFGGEAWHGPALRNLLDGVTDDQAKSHPIRGAHSILELVVHVGTWNDVVAQRVGGTAVESKDVDDWADVAKIQWPEAIQ